MGARPSQADSPTSPREIPMKRILPLLTIAMSFALAGIAEASHHKMQHGPRQMTAAESDRAVPKNCCITHAATGGAGEPGPPVPLPNTQLDRMVEYTVCAWESAS